MFLWFCVPHGSKYPFCVNEVNYFKDGFQELKILCVEWNTHDDIILCIQSTDVAFSHVAICIFNKDRLFWSKLYKKLNFIKVFYNNCSLFQAIYSLPRGCKISILILMLPQLYWFFLIVKGATQLGMAKRKKKKAMWNILITYRALFHLLKWENTSIPCTRD